MQRARIDISKVIPNEGQIEGLPRNPRLIRDGKFRKLCRSIRSLPEMTEARDIIVYPRDGRYIVIGGNMRLQAYRHLGWKEVPCCILLEDCPVEKLRQMAIQDNNPFGENDWDALANEWDSLELEEWGFDVWQEPKGGENRNTGKKEEQENVEDYRFTAIWNNPLQVLESGCTELVEPNLSLFDTTPVAYGLQLIYMKRWIARLWQECGARIYADLNVSRKFYKYNRLGIPDGYNAFATRGYSDRQEYLKMEIQTARDISGLDKPNMIVYGGGEKIHEICLQNNVLYVEQFMANRAKQIKKGGRQNV